MTEARFNIIERFGDSDVQDLCMEIRRLRDALGEIYLTFEGDYEIAAMCNLMGRRAIEALTTETWALHADNGGFR